MSRVGKYITSVKVESQTLKIKALSLILGIMVKTD
jgi:hypothetical protein